MENKKFTVTVGISAYNEGQNIVYLLESIFKQERSSYNLEKIIVISDGSTDDMEEKVGMLSKKYPIITLVNDHKRLGKTRRIMEIFKLNYSDVIILLDGDVVLGDQFVIKRIVSKFAKKEITVVSGNIQPVHSETFIGSLIQTWFLLWYEIRRNINRGDCIHNSMSAILALRKEFAEKLELSPTFLSVGQFIYCAAKKEHRMFCFEDSAIIYFQLPETKNEFLDQNNRYDNIRKNLAAYFGDWIYGLYIIPNKIKFKIILKHILLNPIDTILATIFILVVPHFSHRLIEKAKDGIWTTIPSTKRGLNIVNF